MSRSAVVTGSTGAIGKALCRSLTARGWSVLALGGRTSGFDVVERQRVLALREHIPLGAVFFHLAGRAHEHTEAREDENLYRRVNVDGTVHVLELAQEVAATRFVFASTVATYGVIDRLVDEETRCDPTTAYGRTKLAAEERVRASSVPSVLLRLPMVYGGVDRGNMTRMISAIMRRRFPPLPPFHNRRSVLHVENAVDAMQLVAVEERAAGETFIVTDRETVSTTDIYHTTLDTLGRRPPPVLVPMAMLRLAARGGDLGRKILGYRLPLDSSALAKLTESAEYSSYKITSRLGFSPRLGLKDGIRTVVDELLRRAS